MKIIIFGSSGRTGRHLVSQGLDQGFDVTAFTRSKNKLDLTHTKLKIAEGDVLNLDDVRDAVHGHDAVICALGHPSILDKSRIRTRGTKNIIMAMKAQGVKNLVCQSSFGTGDSFELMPLMYRFLIAPLLMRHLLADHLGQESLIKQSDLDWTIVRPAALSDGALTKVYQHGFSKNECIKTKISRADTAHMMLSQLLGQQYLYQTPCLSY